MQIYIWLQAAIIKNCIIKRLQSVLNDINDERINNILEKENQLNYDEKLKFCIMN